MRPSREDFKAGYKEGCIIPVCEEISSDRITPGDGYYAAGAVYLLESAERGAQVGRYSFLGIDTECRIESRGEECSVTHGSVTANTRRSDPLSALKEVLSSRTYAGSGDLSPFPGGAVGYIGYEQVQCFESIKLNAAKKGIDIPDSVFIITRMVVAFDHLMHTVKVIANVRAEGNPDAEYEKAEADIKKIISQLSSYREQDCDARSFSAGEKIRSSMSQQEYMDAVVSIKEQIAAGEAIQVVLSQRMELDFSGDSFSVYRALRSINPSPYMFYLNFGNFILLGTSPEVMVRVDKGKAMLRPIAGTRPRGANEEQDSALTSELLADEKERAEHIMLVDLARNDLGRIGIPGTVNVDRFMEVERSTLTVPGMWTVSWKWNDIPM
ncbi:MAG: anthranilate synthase component I family protein [Spirochaetota bacterium]